MQIRKAIAISGIVQGVGFRPYVYRLAAKIGLSGHITNTPAGVSIEVQGEPDRVGDFLARLPAEAPPLASITRIEVADCPCNGDQQFEILPSEGAAEPTALVSPDVAVCDDCLRELLDPDDRRYRYPFINCTNCGPRFTIVRSIPYDRSRTSMAVFPMCPACRAEYENPSDRRFHAQPNACWTCGPRVELLDCAGRPLDVTDPVLEAIERLREGGIVAVKGLGGFHLACDATSAEAVRRLRSAKRRVEKPFAVMMASVKAVEQACELDEEAHALLTGPQHPIVLLRRKTGSGIADDVAPCNSYLGVFLPYTPLHHRLVVEGQFLALVMTSGNLSEEPIAIENREAVERLRGLADIFLVHNRDILLRCDDSVVRFSMGRLRLIRRSRGFVPVPLFLRDVLPPILAVGGELKNTVCLTKRDQAFLSQHIGDLENLEGYRFFEEAIMCLEKILEIRPETIACDMHPRYFSTQWARQQLGVCHVEVQHHHAHIAACMAEHQLDGQVIGFAMDGTGYGTDGAVWGGEVLLADYGQFRRGAHFAYVPMPGGEAAIREPWRMALSYLRQHFGRSWQDLPVPFLEHIDSRRVDLVIRMLERGVNSPQTSSCGRLFDAVAALVGIRQEVNYEGQAAIELEMMTEQGADDSAYPFALAHGAGTWVIDTRPMFETLLLDLREGTSAADIGARFHNGLVVVLTRIALLLRDETGLDRVCLGGGCFQNAYLLERVRARLEDRGFAVFAPERVPANDGGLSLGQALVAAHRLCG